jgi:hypothetical protein
MNINGAGTLSLLDSVLNAESTRQEIGVAVLKKAQDAQTQEGEALIKMLETSGPPALLDVYA